MRKVKNAENVDLLLPRYDFVFKGLFGQEDHKRVLISLLNSILDGNPFIQDITLENTDIPKDMEDGKSVRLDIRATTDENTKIQIEIQCQDEGNIVNRAAFGQSKMLPEELHEGDEYDSLPNLISIWITNYNETGRNYHTHKIRFMYEEDPAGNPAVSASDKFRIFIIELEKIDEKRANISDLFSVWMSFLKAPQTIPPEFLTIKEVKEAMEGLIHLSQDPETRRIYNMRLKAQNDAINARSHDVNKARREGIEKGKAEGKRETAINLLSMGMTAEDVSKATGLSVAQIKALQK
ncbi:transposase [Alphaproteobacteria bacterium]|nr:transposase [Alphaproteobacteria bacterium]